MTALGLKEWLANTPRAVVLDVRLGRAFSAAHLVGAVSLPYSQRGWTEKVQAWLADGEPDRVVVLFSDNPVIAGAAEKALGEVGIAVQEVWTEGIEPWTEAGLPVVSVTNITVDGLRRELDQWRVIDVREPYELRSGIIPGAINIPLGQLADRLSELDRGQRWVTVCASGNRSQQASAYLADHGYQVANVVGGMSLWMGAGNPLER